LITWYSCIKECMLDIMFNSIHFFYFSFKHHIALKMFFFFIVKASKDLISYIYNDYFFTNLILCMLIATWMFISFWYWLMWNSLGYEWLDDYFFSVQDSHINHQHYSPAELFTGFFKPRGTHKGAKQPFFFLLKFFFFCFEN